MKMITRKNYLTIVFSILGIIISYIIFFEIYGYIADKRLNTIEKNSDFDITSILNISKSRITAESETFNKGKFIEYDCVVDSTYYISVVKVGQIIDIKILDSLHFESQPIPSRTGWFNYNITTPYPLTHMFHTSIVPLYNVFLLPLERIDKINIFFSGEILEKEWLNNLTLSYFLTMPHTQISFNNMNKEDLIFSRSGFNPLSSYNIFFTIDGKNNLYIGCASTHIGRPKTLKEIVNKK